MSFDLDRDLGAWEQGFLALHDVERRHPEDDVWGLIVLHERLSRLTELPASELSGTWSRIEPCLRGRPPHRRARVLLAAALLLLLGGATAYAVEPVGEGLRAAWQTFASLFQGGEPDSGEGGSAPGRSVRLPRSETAEDKGPALALNPHPIGAEERGTARGEIADPAEGSGDRTEEKQVQDQALTPDDMTDDEAADDDPPVRASSEDPADDGYPVSALYGPDDDDSDEEPVSVAVTITTSTEDDG